MRDRNRLLEVLGDRGSLRRLGALAAAKQLTSETRLTMPIRILEPPDSPWGDYGDILRHGMADSSGRGDDDPVLLERAGPIIPPISFPGSEIIVTNDCRSKLEASGLTGFSFRSVDKVRIVDLAWHTWDVTADDPPEYPDSGEPEDYLLEREHSPAIAEAMGPLWGLVLSEAADTERESPEDRWNERIYLKVATWNGADLFRAHGVGWIFASDAAQAWLTRELGEHVSFRDCLLR